MDNLPLTRLRGVGSSNGSGDRRELLLRRIERIDDWAWGAVPIAMGRIRTFIERYHTEQDGDALCNFVMVHFTAVTNRLGLWVATLGDNIVGHLFASMEETKCGKCTIWNEDCKMCKRWAFVMQVECDVPTTPKLSREMMVALQVWCKSWKATHIEIYVDTMSRQRLWTRIGFKPKRVQMRLEIK